MMEYVNTRKRHSAHWHFRVIIGGIGLGVMALILAMTGCVSIPDVPNHTTLEATIGGDATTPTLRIAGNADGLLATSEITMSGYRLADGTTSFTAHIGRNEDNLASVAKTGIIGSSMATGAASGAGVGAVATGGNPVGALAGGAIGAAVPVIAGKVAGK